MTKSPSTRLEIRDGPVGVQSFGGSGPGFMMACDLPLDYEPTRDILITPTLASSSPIGINTTEKTATLACKSASGMEVFRVTPENRIFCDDVDVTEDDAALAKCFVDLLQVVYGVEVQRTKE